ncbi:MAG: Flp family type IVb pilin [Candidatus Binataceae bacterium]
MNWTARVYLRLREKATEMMRRDLSQGQTMTEYALILAAVAVVVYATYTTMGGAITTKISAIDTALGA